MMRGRLVGSIAGCALLGLWTSCAESPAPNRPAAAPLPTTVPVGPLPGPAEFNAAAVVNPMAGEPLALQEGRRFFLAYNCAGCHGDHGGGGMGPSLRDHLWLYGASDAQVANSIAQGRSFGMPAWSEMLTAEQIWKITAYVKSMRTDAEVDPPTGR
jgi:cytochrome c oxidase cbb3-type subunit 3